ncbi:DNA-3-methyladenine glycosylase 2 family protein [Shewanella fidelis]|uniref:DNA-3-methyladenine glycosylase II n=1 Tax=Shewanella fidelis TaxID=173509 RepID=A0AAW8NMF3_9GAMM|nr:Ada metal-binding domain-containing protein [Shewanella fidelis]MDR8524372.1 helix-turn-helix domain-containing protein [Shewanella fidelis]MDW4813419.1 helix-turn-helix domain-containing protein [Shewanella fidelis]MDW4817658.1 helix-turn-helix domain-containing protein [Shewanella fidelis]MDW4821725.1 helix-turn-helix domain-containing protein [Shewanella fidelis]MDW4825890.1 helix-turn-helix domain-containing protein [Shewanella fidelis]
MVEHDCQTDLQACRKARLARDPRFDGQFFIGVLTTKIYCRPICPAVSPKEQNVRYFDTALQAANAGLRPCLRCRPDSAPQSYAWKGTQTTLERAKALIDSGAITGQGGQSIEDLATRLGISSRYLRKLFQDKLGTSVKSYAQYQQLMLAKQLLHQTKLTITQVAFAAGFNSIRRFNEVFQQTLQLTPSHLRKTANIDTKAEQSEVKGRVALKLQLSYRPPLRWPEQHHFYQVRAVQNMEWLEDEFSYGRSFSINEVSGYFNARLDSAANLFNVEIVLADNSALPQLGLIINEIRRVLDLNANIAQIDKALLELNPISSLMREGLRLPGVWSAFEAGCRAVLGQQVSIVQASKLLNQLVLAYGEERIIGDRRVKLFPTPEIIASAELSELKMPNARKKALNALAQFVSENPDADLSDWLSIKGIGPWTVAYAKMRGQSDPDVLLCGDLVVKKRILALYAEHGLNNDNYTDITDSLAKQIAPWGSYLTFQLWNL